MARLTLLDWPVLRQLRGADPTGRGSAVTSARTRSTVPRTSTADGMAESICPYCAVGCSQRIFHQDGKVIQIEGNPESPVSRGRLCPKGAASEQLANSYLRQTTVRYRRPYATEWEEIDLDTALEMVADRVLDARERFWEHTDANGDTVQRTRGIASLGGATLDNEENYLMKKLYTALGAIEVENQARI